MTVRNSGGGTFLTFNVAANSSFQNRQATSVFDLDGEIKTARFKVAPATAVFDIDGEILSNALVYKTISAVFAFSTTKRANLLQPLTYTQQLSSGTFIFNGL